MRDFNGWQRSVVLKKNLSTKKILNPFGLDSLSF